MTLRNKRIGFGLTGSHCTYDVVFPQLQQLVDLGADVVPIVTYTVKHVDTRFGEAKEHLDTITKITKKKPLSSIPETEPLGPIMPLDCMVIAPLTGNSLSKFANAITDNPVLMAAKATLRNRKPVVVGISTNDALGLNGMNVMRLLNAKHIYFIPFGQDDPYKKPTSLVAYMDLLVPTVEAALCDEQIQPVIVPYSN